MEGSSHAPIYRVPFKDIVSVEHPCIVKNIEKGISMLGGPNSIKEILEPGSVSTLGLNFSPDDPSSRPILSFNTQTDNVLLRITIPKRIGKRKRGSAEPVVPLDAADSKRDAQHLIQSLKNNSTNFKVEPLGTVESSHIWRSMPDFAYSTQGSDFLSKVKSDILPRTLPSLKRFDIATIHSKNKSEVVPPPVLSTIPLPQQYSYRQSRHGAEAVGPESAQQSVDGADSNGSAYLITIHNLEEPCPTTPDARVPSLSTQPKSIRKIQAVLVKLFDQRPIWTRRALLNELPEDVTLDKLRFGLAYVAFGIRTGPWRDCLCKFGVDPQDSPKYRKFQTILITRSDGDKKSRSNHWTRNDDKMSHVFTGRDPQPQDGSVWQFCDIADPQLKALVDLDESQLPPTCESNSFGWYHNGTVGKLRTAMRVKLDALNESDQFDESVLERFLSVLPERLPYFDLDEVEVGNPLYGYLPPPTTELEAEMTADFRNFIRYGMLKQFREAKERGEAIRDEPDLRDHIVRQHEDAASDEARIDGPAFAGEGVAGDWLANDRHDFSQNADIMLIVDDNDSTAFEAAWSASNQVAQSTAPSNQRLTAFEAAWSGPEDQLVAVESAVK